MEAILVITIAILSYLAGRMHNRERWIMAGKVYASARRTYKDNLDLYLENQILKHQLRKSDKDDNSI